MVVPGVILPRRPRPPVVGDLVDDPTTGEVEARVVRDLGRGVHDDCVVTAEVSRDGGQRQASTPRSCHRDRPGVGDRPVAVRGKHRLGGRTERRSGRVDRGSADPRGAQIGHLGRHRQSRFDLLGQLDDQLPKLIRRQQFERIGKLVRISTRDVRNNLLGAQASSGGTHVGPPFQPS